MSGKLPDHSSTRLLGEVDPAFGAWSPVGAPPSGTRHGSHHRAVGVALAAIDEGAAGICCRPSTCKHLYLSGGDRDAFGAGALP